MRVRTRRTAPVAETTNRRTMLTRALGGAALVGFAPLASACGSSGVEALDAEALTDDLTLLRGAGATVAALATDDGLVLVDSGAAARAGDLVSHLRTLRGRGRVAAVLNTHHHADQTGGNAALADAGAERIIAHERARLRMSHRLWSPAEGRYVPARAEAAWPTDGLYTTGALTAGDHQVLFGYLQHAHTDGDIYVRVPVADVLMVGDVASPERDPVFDWVAGGWLGGRVDALALLLEIAGDDTRIVPSYGPVMTRVDLVAEHALMTELYERTHTLFRQGRSAEDMFAEGALDGLGRDFTDPARLLYDIHKGLWGHQSSMSPDIV